MGTPGEDPGLHRAGHSAEGLCALLHCLALYGYWASIYSPHTCTCWARSLGGGGQHNPHPQGAHSLMEETDHRKASRRTYAISGVAKVRSGKVREEDTGEGQEIWAVSPCRRGMGWGGCAEISGTGLLAGGAASAKPLWWECAVSGKVAGVARTEQPTGEGGRCVHSSLFIYLFVIHSSSLM